MPIQGLIINGNLKSEYPGSWYPVLGLRLSESLANQPDRTNDED